MPEIRPLNHVIRGVALTAFVAACSGPYGEEAAPQADDALTEAADFVGTDLPKAAAIGAYAAERRPASAAVASQLALLNRFEANPTIAFTAGVFTLNVADLGAFDSSRSGTIEKHMAYDFLFRADGSTPGGPGNGWWEKWVDSEYETLGCEIVAQPKDALRMFREFPACADVLAYDKAKRRTAEDAIAALVGSLVKDVGAATVYKCHWDNHDDTDADALVTANYQTGEVRVVLSVAW